MQSDKSAAASLEARLTEGMEGVKAEAVGAGAAAAQQAVALFAQQRADATQESIATVSAAVTVCARHPHA
jgi:hypothetical protein